MKMYFRLEKKCRCNINIISNVDYIFNCYIVINANSISLKNINKYRYT